MVVGVVTGLLGSVPLTQKRSFLIRERERERTLNEMNFWYGICFLIFIFLDWFCDAVFEQLLPSCIGEIVVLYLIPIAMIAVLIISVALDLVLKLSQTNDLSLKIFDRSCSSDLRHISGHKNTRERWKIEQLVFCLFLPVKYVCFFEKCFCCATSFRLS